MARSFVITLRERLEAALIVGIILVYRNPPVAGGYMGQLEGLAGEVYWPMWPVPTMGSNAPRFGE
ncbi:MAG: hypothetical protein HYU86_11825 [Chloroflexi bacterium]|nr:hypothetical protein [Chloroflexota bacterium]